MKWHVVLSFPLAKSREGPAVSTVLLSNRIQPPPPEANDDDENFDTDDDYSAAGSTVMQALSHT